jgi:DNA-binding transcriptional LysR family regulator
LPNGTIFGWQFEKNRKSLQLNVDGRLVVNDIELSIRAVLDGLGLAYLLEDYIREHVKDGRLIALLEDWSPHLSGFYLYYSSRRQMGAPLQAFINFLAAESKQRGLAKSNLPGERIYPNYKLVGSRSRRT